MVRKITDIVVYTNPDTLKLKRDYVKYTECWWTFSRMPKDFDDMSKFYFAVEGKVVGYFLTVWITKKRIYFNPLSWRRMGRRIPCKPFRGFRYRWWGR